MIDGVPMVEFGAVVDVAPASTVYIILYPVPDYIADQEFLYEDDVTQNLFLERIRGEVYMVWQDEAFDTAGWSLRPMGVEYDTVSVLQPFTAPWTWTLPEYENLPSWANRVYQVPSASAYPDLVDHPWWTHVEVKPRRMMGVRRNQWPVLAVRNNNPNVRLSVIHRLKAWYR